ncbi:glycosyltransferase [Flavobacterium agricola]|uniref:Glycosyltransferase n=1 Tax=Flavobacterium agricola TaxID=2870839 RepID=A0ABY6LYA6_9FLAO|nr:glycosyltransferase [Flavobacterium agricola]UYW01312.1 glycosyltransferase [Flavobacterium agricola]
MEIVVYFIAVVLVYYSIQLGLLIYGVLKAKKFAYSTFPEVAIKFTIVIPFKNEANNLPHLLASITNLNYDKNNFEIILVDDASTDASVQVIADWRLANPFIQTTILTNVVVSKSSKKDAISRAVSVAKNDWIITTDADCILPANFLACYAAYVFQNSEQSFIIGGVGVEPSHKFLFQYQALDFASLQAVTLGSCFIDETFMCNGANLAFTKQFFAKVKGYDGVNHIASGDDVFLLQKALQYKSNCVGYLLHQDATIITEPVLSWSALVKQRARWGAKATAYQSAYPKVLGIITLLANFSVIFLLVALFIPSYFAISLLLLTIKFVCELALLTCFKKHTEWVSLRYFPISFLLYPFFTLLVTLRMLFFTPRWK